LLVWLIVFWLRLCQWMILLIPLPVLLSPNYHLWLTIFSCMISGVWWMTGFRVRMYITISSPQSARAFTFIRRGWLSIYSFWTWHRSFILPISYRWAFVRLFGWYAASWNHFLLQSKVKCWRDSIVIFLRQKLFLANYKNIITPKDILQADCLLCFRLILVAEFDGRKRAMAWPWSLVSLQTDRLHQLPSFSGKKEGKNNYVRHITKTLLFWTKFIQTLNNIKTGGHQCV